MPHITFWTVVKLIAASLVVGLILDYLDLGPEDVLALVAGVAQDLMASVGDIAERAASYVLLGAVIVVPLWLAVQLWRKMRGRL